MLQSVIIANQQNGQIVFSHHFNSVLFDRQPEANMEKEDVELCLKSGQKEGNVQRRDDDGEPIVYRKEGVLLIAVSSTASPFIGENKAALDLLHSLVAILTQHLKISTEKHVTHNKEGIRVLLGQMVRGGVLTETRLSHLSAINYFNPAPEEDG